LLDRIDIHIEVPRVDYEKLSGDRVGASSESTRAESKPPESSYKPVSRIPNLEYRKTVLLLMVSNADMRVGEIRKFCKPQG
jgi:magnesium chelatase family protein